MYLAFILWNVPIMSRLKMDQKPAANQQRAAGGGEDQYGGGRRSRRNIETGQAIRGQVGAQNPDG
jgi:hypothetical protein